MFWYVIVCWWAVVCNVDVISAEHWLKGENGLFYLINNNLLSWADANHECEIKSARLITINDKKSRSNAENIIAGRERQQYWIGLSEDLFRRWFWSKGNSLGFSNWEKGEPRELNDQLRCASMNSVAGWLSEDCDNKRRSICQRHFPNNKDQMTTKIRINSIKSNMKQKPETMARQNKTKQLDDKSVFMTTENKTQQINKTTHRNITKNENSTRKSLILNSADSAENEDDHFVGAEYDKLVPPNESKKYMKNEIALMNQMLKDFRTGSEYTNPTVKEKKTTVSPTETDRTSKRMKRRGSTFGTIGKPGILGKGTTKNLITRPRSTDSVFQLLSPRHRSPTVKTIIVPFAYKQARPSLKEALKTLDPEAAVLQRDVTSLRSVKVEGGQESCMFPFVYTSISYFDCIPSETRKDKTWCATTNNFDRDLKWGYCEDRSNISKNKTLASGVVVIDALDNTNLQQNISNVTQILNPQIQSNKSNLTSLFGNNATPEKILNNTIILKDVEEDLPTEKSNQTSKATVVTDNMQSDDTIKPTCLSCADNATSSTCETCKAMNECEACKQAGETKCDSCSNNGMKSMSEGNKNKSANNEDITSEVLDPGKNTASEEQGNKDIDELLGQVLEQQGLTKQEQSQIIGTEEKNKENQTKESKYSSSTPLQSLEDAEKNILNVDEKLMQEQEKINTSLNTTKKISEHLREKDGDLKANHTPVPVEDNLITTYDQKSENDEKLITAAEVDAKQNNATDKNNTIVNENHNTTQVNPTSIRQNITDQSPIDGYDHLQPEGIKLLSKNPDPLKNSDFDKEAANTDKWHFLNVENFDGLSTYLNTTRHMKPHIVAGLVIPIMTDIPLSHNNTEEGLLKRKTTTNKIGGRGEKQERAQNKGDIILTYGGNSNNEPCEFPFIYDGDSHFDCIDNGIKKAWCGTTDNYDKMPLWGYCCFDADCIQRSKTIKRTKKQKPKGETVHYISPASIQYPQPKHLLKIVSKNAPKRTTKKKGGKKMRKSDFKEESKSTDAIKGDTVKGDTNNVEELTKNSNQNKTIPMTSSSSSSSSSQQNYYPQYNSYPIYYGAQNYPNYASNVNNNNNNNNNIPLSTYTGASIYPKDTNTNIIPNSNGETVNAANNLFLHSGVKTYGGNSNGQNCIIPFVFGGRIHNTCIPRDDMTSWCSTTNNFDTDLRWGNCCDSKKCAYVW